MHDAELVRFDHRGARLQDVVDRLLVVEPTASLELDLEVVPSRNSITMYGKAVAA